MCVCVCVYTPHLYSFVYQWALRLLLYLGYDKGAMNVGVHIYSIEMKNKSKREILHDHTYIQNLKIKTKDNNRQQMCGCQNGGALDG